MRVWIDLANAPHVAFFLPMVAEMRRRGHDVVMTLRDFNQTVELARHNGLDGEVIGHHGGRSSAGKLVNLLGRAGGLARFGQRAGVDVAVSHNSYTQTIAGRMIRTRVVTFMDFEGQPANHIAFRLAHRVIVPAAFPQSSLRRFGCRPSRVCRYEGFKEQVYLSDFRPDPEFPCKLARACGLGPGWSPERSILVTVRAPPVLAAYHRFDNRLFAGLLQKLESRSDATVVLLPRTQSLREPYQSRVPRLRIPSQPLSGQDLVALSDLVVSAGGTMNREAAVLGTPVCTIFAGKLPAVDRSLMAMGRLVWIGSEKDVASLRIVKKRAGTPLSNPGLASTLVDWIVSS